MIIRFSFLNLRECKQRVVGSPLPKHSICHCELYTIPLISECPCEKYPLFLFFWLRDTRETKYKWHFIKTNRFGSSSLSVLLFSFACWLASLDSCVQCSEQVFIWFHSSILVLIVWSTGKQGNVINICSAWLALTRRGRSRPIESDAGQSSLIKLFDYVW